MLLEGLERRIDDRNEASVFHRKRRCDQLQDRPASRFQLYLCITNGAVTIIAFARWAKDAVRKAEAVALRSLHEEVLLRGCHFVDHRTERGTKSSEPLRITLIDASNVAAELRPACPSSSTWIGAQAHAGAFKYTNQLTQRNRR